jgi:hypothetical protein
MFFFFFFFFFVFFFLFSFSSSFSSPSPPPPSPSPSPSSASLRFAVLDLLVAGHPVSDDEATRHCYLDGKFLQHCSPQQRNTFSICATAVTNRGNALRWCSEEGQDNVQLVPHPPPRSSFLPPFFFLLAAGVFFCLGGLLQGPVEKWAARAPELP